MSLERDLNTFSSFAGLESPSCRISMVGPNILHLTNKSSQKSETTLGFLALVHGNELLGLPILNSLIQSILSGEQKINSDLYFGLGNIPAAFADKRFIEEDLNRCFGKSNTDTQESKRARELENLMLDHCEYLLDIHQTIFSSKDPFFIFQYSSERCLSIIEKWNLGVPVILQEEQLGENTGLCADEYMRSQGGFGAALELGQLGTTEHFHLGMEICKKALAVTNIPLREIGDPFNFEVLKLKSSYKVKDSSYKLDEGWKNLKPFNEGERLGTCDSGIIRAPTFGYMLFPRYRPVSEGQELFYYCTPMFLKTESHLKAKEETCNLSTV